MPSTTKKFSILRYLAHVLYPYIFEDQERREAHALRQKMAQCKSCGNWYQVKQSYNIRGCEYITIGENFRAGAHMRLEAIDSYEEETFSPELIIGNNVAIQDFCHIGCVEKVVIGDGTLIASKVFISDHMHGHITVEDLTCRPELRKINHQPVCIGTNVWIGEGASILAGVTLGDNVIVGANAVVTRSFPANCVIAGCPAKVIKQLV